MKNIAFIDGQNLHLGTWGSDKLVEEEVINNEDRWRVDSGKFRTYLKDKYKVEEAYYFFGYINEDYQELYNSLQKAGFILQFREHSRQHETKKKGNVDTEIVFTIMQKLVDEMDAIGKIVLVSGDGDYKRLIDYLIKKKKFLKILHPNKKYASSLYKKLGSEYYDFLENKTVRNRIEYK